MRLLEGGAAAQCSARGPSRPARARTRMSTGRSAGISCTQVPVLVTVAHVASGLGLSKMLNAPDKGAGMAIWDSYSCSHPCPALLPGGVVADWSCLHSTIGSSLFLAQPGSNTCRADGRVRWAKMASTAVHEQRAWASGFFHAW